mgnify:CR=1 FL=1
MPTLIVTNDFPPRTGGIESFVRTVCGLLDDDVVILTRSEPHLQTDQYDAGLGFPVHRVAGPLLPTPRLAKTALALAVEHQTSSVLFGAAAPLALLSRPLRPLAARAVALTHGHEVWWSRVPGTRGALRRIGADVDALGVISDHTAYAISGALRAADRRKLVTLPPPVDLTRFSPGPPCPDPVVLAAGRLVPQKGFSTLLDAWPAVLQHLPDARLRIVGEGPDRRRLERRARALRGVTFLGAQPHGVMPVVYRSARVLALPVRSLLHGLYAEGRGLVFSEAAACGLPVVVGDSGGAPETVVDGVTGSVVPPEDPAALAASVLSYLADPAAAREAGLRGREHVRRTSEAGLVRARLRHALGLPG